jgi:hypothetical protein
MANFNFGINCDSIKDAKALEKYIQNLDIYQDGLDCQDERVIVISKSALKSELKRYATTAKVTLKVEIWPEDYEYDDAESEDRIEVVEYVGNKSPKTASSKGPQKFKSYTGTKEMRDAYKSWVLSGKLPGLTITGEWDAQVEYGSWGVEFQSDVPGVIKLIDQEWLKKGVITEKMK